MVLFILSFSVSPCLSSCGLFEHFLHFILLYLFCYIALHCISLLVAVGFKNTYLSSDSLIGIEILPSQV